MSDKIELDKKAFDELMEVVIYFDRELRLGGGGHLNHNTLDDWSQIEHKLSQALRKLDYEGYR